MGAHLDPAHLAASQPGVRGVAAVRTPCRPGRRGPCGSPCGPAADRAGGCPGDRDHRTSTTDPTPTFAAPVATTFAPERIRRLTGVDELDATRQRALLARSGVEVSDGDGGHLTAAPPSWRGDLGREADLAEEVARLHGYDHIPAELPAADDDRRPHRDAARRTRGPRQLALAGGFHEAITRPFVGDAALLGVVPSAGRVGLENPLAKDAAALRPTLVEGLLQARPPQRRPGSSRDGAGRARTALPARRRRRSATALDAVGGGRLALARHGRARAAGPAAHDRAGRPGAAGRCRLARPRRPLGGDRPPRRPRPGRRAAHGRRRGRPRARRRSNAPAGTPAGPSRSTSAATRSGWPASCTRRGRRARPPRAGRRRPSWSSNRCCARSRRGPSPSIARPAGQAPRDVHRRRAGRGRRRAVHGPRVRGP